MEVPLNSESIYFYAIVSEARRSRSSEGGAGDSAPFSSPPLPLSCALFGCLKSCAGEEARRAGGGGGGGGAKLSKATSSTKLTDGELMAEVARGMPP